MTMQLGDFVFAQKSTGEVKYLGLWGVRGVTPQAAADLVAFSRFPGTMKAWDRSLNGWVLYI